LKSEELEPFFYIKQSFVCVEIILFKSKKMNSQFIHRSAQGTIFLKIWDQMKESMVSLVSPLQASKANEDPHSEVKVNDYKVVTFF
jgi:hypothetical protein